MSIIFSPIWFGPHCNICDLQPTEVVVPCGAFLPFKFCPTSKDESQTSVMATTRLASCVLSYDGTSSSQSSSGNLSSSEIAAIAIGTVLAVGVVYLLLFCPHFLFAWLRKSRSGHRPSESEEAPLEDLPPQRPAGVSDDVGSSNGADDTEKRRRRPEAGHGEVLNRKVTIP